MRIQCEVPVLLWLFLCMTTSVFAGDLRWVDGDSLTVEGRAFDVRASTWDRLPAKAESVVRPPVWGNSRQKPGHMFKAIFRKAIGNMAMCKIAVAVRTPKLLNGLVLCAAMRSLPMARICRIRTWT